MARIRISTFARAAGVTGPWGRVLRVWEVSIAKELRRRLAIMRAEARKVGRRTYQRELRRAAPTRTRKLQRSIRVSARNLGSDSVRLRVRMRFYGIILNGARWSKHYRWASEARRRATPVIERDITTALRRLRF